VNGRRLPFLVLFAALGVLPLTNAGADVAQVGSIVGGQPDPPPGSSRDRRRETAGTARISGRVVGGDADKPLRRAQVRLQGKGEPEGRTVSTDEDGRYEVRDLPAGTYSVMASKGGYVTVVYGQRRTFELPRPISLSAGQRLDNVDFNLPPGSVIAGRVTDDLGDPVTNIAVHVLRYRRVNGRRALMPEGLRANHRTDDLGRYRIFGLPGGKYYVSVNAAESDTYGMVPWDTNEGVVRTYFPGTPNIADAQRVRVRPGEEITSINFALGTGRASRISGTVTTSSGQPATEGHVMLEDSGNVFGGRGGGAIHPDGRFTISNVSPGDYTLYVNIGDEAESALVRISVLDEDVTGLSIVTSPGTQLTGQMVFETNPTIPVKATDFSFMASSPQSASWFGGAYFTLKEDWTFETRLHEGPAIIRAGQLPDEWTVKAVLHDGADVTDNGIDLRAGGRVEGIQIVVSNRISSIEGTVVDDRGKLMNDYIVVVFPEDSSRWGPMSRQLFVARPAQTGRYEITKLPPGRYLAAAVEYLTEDEQHTDPEFLEQLRAHATDFEIRDGDRRVLNLKLVNGVQASR
jgi:hypothetical protein